MATGGMDMKVHIHVVLHPSQRLLLELPAVPGGQTG